MSIDLKNCWAQFVNYSSFVKKTQMHSSEFNKH